MFRFLSAGERLWSGCGKTTCGRTCIGILGRTDGHVLYKGKDVHSLRGKERKEFTKEVQIIFQDPYSSLDPKMKVGDIIAEGLKAHHMCKSREEEQARVKELLETVGLNAEHATRYVHEFSGGQRQRIGIARALAVEPEFIVCDEPISALDVSIQAQIVNLLIRLQKEKGLTYLFIAHDLSVVRHISNRIGVMYLGSLVELGESYERRPYTPIPCTHIPRRCFPRSPSRIRRWRKRSRGSVWRESSPARWTRRRAAGSSTAAGLPVNDAGRSGRSCWKWSRAIWWHVIIVKR